MTTSYSLRFTTRGFADTLAESRYLREQGYTPSKRDTRRLLLTDFFRLRPGWVMRDQSDQSADQSFAPGQRGNQMSRKRIILSGE